MKQARITAQVKMHLKETKQYSFINRGIAKNAAHIATAHLRKGTVPTDPVALKGYWKLLDDFVEQLKKEQHGDV